MNKLLPLVLTIIASSASGHGPGKTNDFNGRRVLFVGIDGCRADAVSEAIERGLAPQLKALVEGEGGLFTRSCYAGGELNTPTHQPTVSGPGWSSLITGAWIDRHHVKDNNFVGARFQACPHFMRRIKEVRPTAWCGSCVDWPPIHRNIADGSRVKGAEFLDLKFTAEPDASRHFIDNPEKDIEVRDVALKALRAQNPDALFVYFGSVDETGHGAIDERGSFSSENSLYLNAISHVDSHIGELLRAMRARPQFADEDWLVLVCTDHGGRGNSHGGNSDAERKIWLAASGRHLNRDALMTSPVPQTALVPMIYEHLGIKPKPEWNPEPHSEPSSSSSSSPAAHSPAARRAK